MKMHDFNIEREHVILLIHPMLSSANRMALCTMPHMGNEYRYLIPDLSGHGEDALHTYKSAGIEAKAIHNYLKENQITSLHFAFGASLGGVVLFELLKFTDINFSRIFFEGVSFYEHAFILNFVLSNMLLAKHRKAKSNLALSAKKMESLYGEENAEDMAKCFIAMSRESIINIVHDCAFVNLPELTEEIQQKCTFAYGERDGDLKKARKAQPVKYPKAELTIWPGCGHCEKMTDESKKYAKMLQSYFL